MDLFDVTSWGPVATLVIGGIAGALVFWLGLLLVRRRPEAEPEEHEEAPADRDYGPEGPDEDSPNDPFVGGRQKRDRRASLRRAGNPIAILITDAETQADPIDGWVLDRSTGGLCMGLEVEVDPGTVLSVRARNAPQTVPWWQIEVKNCRRNGKDYELGCEWVRTPPWSVLLLFG